MKLNIGSNEVKHNGYLNVDIRDIDGVDIVDDVSKLTKVKYSSVEAIIAHNILEHFPPDKTMVCLKLWAKKLKKKGTLEIGVPDAKARLDILKIHTRNVPLETKLNLEEISKNSL